MAKKRVEYTPEKDYVYYEKEDAANSPAYNNPNGAYRTPTERAAMMKAAMMKAANKAANDPVTLATAQAAANKAAAVTPNNPNGAYRTPTERAAMMKNAPSAPIEPLNPHPLGDVDPIYQTAAGTAAGTATGAAAAAKELLSEDYLRQLADRQEKGFSYDMNADYLYQLYKDQHMRQGKLAMQDTMGQAAALTGGYGNTYAERVGQSAYNQYLQELNDRVPELYQLALNRYQMEGEDLKDMYSILASREAAANEEAWKQKEWDLTLQQFEFDKDKFGKEYALELAKQALKEKVANHDMSIEDAKLVLLQLETQASVDKTYADIDLGYKNLDENRRQFNAELGYKYYDTDANLAYKYYDTNLDNAYNNAKLAQDDKQFYANLYNKTSGGGSPSNSPSNNTTSMTIKTTEDRDAAVAETVQFMLNPAHSADDIDRFVDQWGDWGDIIYALAEQRIRDKDRAKYFKDDRLK